MTHPENNEPINAAEEFIRYGSPKSKIAAEIAAKLGVPVIDIKLSVQRQIIGEPICTTDAKIEYQLKSSRGRLVMSFQDEQRAREEAVARSLTAFRVTTYTEKL